MNKKGVIFIALAVLLVAIAVVAGTELRYRLGRAVGMDAVVLIPTGSSYQALMDSLDSSGALINSGFFRRFADTKRLSKNVRSGRYELKEGMTFAALLNMLRSGNQSPVRVTFNNARTMESLAGSIARRLEIDSASLLTVLKNDSVASGYGFAPGNFIGMFIPNTYEFYWDASPRTITDRMHKEYDKFWEGTRDGKLASLGLTRQQATTLASIVYEETKFEPEMPAVAGVYLNRIKKGMPLQADPTVKFAMGDFSIRRVLNRHLGVDSPYNTYKYAGLPPGPICMPSIAAVDAVLDPQKHDYLYFCAKADLSGAHAFAKTLGEHNRNAQAYARALDKRGIR